MGVSKNRGTTQWMLYIGKTLLNLLKWMVWWENTTIFGNIPINHQQKTARRAKTPIISCGRPILMMVRRSRRQRETGNGEVSAGREIFGTRWVWEVSFTCILFRKICVIFLMLKKTCVGFSLDIRVIGSDLELPPGCELHPSGYFLGV